jgi:hypothetical protein
MAFCDLAKALALAAVALDSGMVQQQRLAADVAAFCHHLIETRPPSIRAGDLVFELRYKFIAALGGRLTQIVNLRLGTPVDSRDPQVKCGADPYLAT